MIILNVEHGSVVSVIFSVSGGRSTGDKNFEDFRGTKFIKATPELF